MSLSERLRRTEVLVEAVRDDVRAVAEGVAVLDEKVERVQTRLEEQAEEGLAPVRAAVVDHTRRLDDHERRIGRIERTAIAG